MSPIYLFVFTKLFSLIGFVVASVMMIIGLVLKGRKWSALIFSGSVLGLIVTVNLLKETFRVPRPEQALIQLNDYAWPSGHAAGSIFLAVTASYLAAGLTKKWRLFVYMIFGILTISIGVSRLHLEVHTVFQVVSGYGLGLIWALIAIVGMRHFKKH